MKKVIERSSIRDMAEKWPSTIIAREKVGEFTGGTINPGTMANLDSLGKGIEDRFRIGRKIVYPLQSFIEFLEARSNNL